MTNVTDEILGKLARQQNDLFRRVREGTLDSNVVSAGLQQIIEGKFASCDPVVSSVNQPSWHRTPAQQLARARQLWPDVVLPEPPVDFVPRSKTEVLLLHVPLSFDQLWEAITPPAGYSKWRSDYVLAGKLRLAPGVPTRTTAVWLGFDPEHGKGERPDQLWGNPELAASEVLSAVIQFPDWPLSWFNGASAPNLSGFQLEYSGKWLRVPCLIRWGVDRQLELRGSDAGHARGSWSSPVVREC